VLSSRHFSMALSIGRLETRIRSRESSSHGSTIRWIASAVGINGGRRLFPSWWALFLAAGLNIDAINVATVLWTQPKLVEELKLPAALPAGSATASPLAEATAPGTSRPGTGATTPAPSGIAASRASNEKTEAADMLHQINTTLPVGWAHGVLLDEKGQWVSWGTFWLALLGWAITALTTLFGAPFWFDLL
jgi:hypothetical protein